MLNLDPEDALAGPFVSAALHCERLLQETDGTLSLIRIVDRITVSAPISPGSVPLSRPIFSLLQGVFILRAGTRSGLAELRMRQVATDGSVTSDITQTITLGGPGQAFRIFQQLTLIISRPGTMWTELYVDGKLLTRIPLEIVFVQPEHPPSSVTPAPQ